MKKVSIIVPIYNTSKYLIKCIDSLVNQTYKNIEIILIDDKSTDNSKKIIKEYSEKYSFIKSIFNKKNMGIGYSRNKGIQESSGDYLCFVDSDDYLDIDNIDKMVALAEKEELDFVVCDLKRIDENNNFIGYDRIKDFSNSNIKNSPNLLLDINLGPCNKLISKTLFNKDDLFSETLKYEDLYLVPKLLCKAKRIGKVKDTYYNYLIHNNSETTTMNKKVFDILEVLENINNYFKKLNYYSNIHEYIEYLNIRTIFRYTLQQKYQANKKIKVEFIDQAFKFLNNNFPNWRKNKLYKKRNVLKRIIESNKFLTKIYCNILSG